MKHKNMTAETCNCGGHTSRCAVCDFGLWVCQVCRGAEDALATECPGRPLTAEEGELICQGVLDFDMGVWFCHDRPVFKDGKVFR